MGSQTKALPFEPLSSANVAMCLLMLGPSAYREGWNGSSDGGNFLQLQ